TYVAPTAATANTTATVTATSVANTGVTATLDITLNTAILGVTPTSLPAATLGTPYNVLISAIGGAAGAFAWSITSGALPDGLVMQPSTTSTVSISGTPTKVGSSIFTIEVTDSASDTSSQQLGIVVSEPLPLTIVTKSLPDATVNTPYNASLQANGGIQPYKWTITQGSLPVGLSMNPAGIISGTPAASGASSFTAQVTDSTEPVPQSQSVNLSITVDPQTSNNAKLNGNYAFQVTGFDPSGIFQAVGSFVADGSGGISDLFIDTNDPTGPTTNTTALSGTYAIGSNNLGLLCFNPSGNVCERAFALSMSADGNARIIEFDDTTGGGTRNSGVLLKQDSSAFSTASISGNYAFGFVGADSSGKRYGLAGAFTASGGAISNGGQLDADDSSSGPSTATITGGSYSVPAGSTSGRGTASLTTASGTTNYTFYIVSAASLLMIETDSVGSGNPIVGGQILQQSGAGTFNNGSLSQTSIEQTTAVCNTTDSQVQAGILNSGGAGTVGLTSDQNCGGSLTQPGGNAGTYSVAGNGRTTFDIPLSNGTTYAPVLYLVASNQGFLIGTDPGVSFGSVQSQTGSAFSNASLSGTYAGGTLAPVQAVISNQSGVAVVGSNTLMFTVNISNGSGLSQNQASSVNFSVTSNGRATLSQTTPQGTTTTEILYLLSPSQFIGIPATSDARVDAYRQ
ncbi:MAG TPA: putative Ig domain-containing protein, partial [Terriglobales bacterium]